MKPDKLELWKRTREKGILKFVLVNGVLSYGLAMFIAMTLVVHRNELTPRYAALSAVIWAIGGAVFGFLTWHLQESRYRKARGPDA